MKKRRLSCASQAKCYSVATSLVVVVVVLLVLVILPSTLGLSSSSSSSRREWLLKTAAPVGAVFTTYGYGRAFFNVLQNAGIKHPAAHEQRVESTIATTMQVAAAAAAAAAQPQSPNILRVLEVGIGTDCRIVRRGLYKKGLQSLVGATSNNGRIDTVQLTGVDLHVPNDEVLEQARQVLQQQQQQQQQQESLIPVVDLQVLQHSITDGKLPFDNGYFDAIICCLTLCSVDDPVVAVQEMNRLLRPAGGAWGFVEHVAVDIAQDGSDLRFLEQQQIWLDPVQQRVAENCHLHRQTQETLQQGLTHATLLTQERFLVNAMWPVSMQACGVFQKTATQ